MPTLSSMVIQSDGLHAVLTWAAASPSWTFPITAQGPKPTFYVTRSGTQYLVPVSLILSFSAADVFSPLVATMQLDVSALPGGRVYGTDTVLGTAPLGVFADASGDLTAGSTKKQGVTNSSIQSTPVTPPSGLAYGDLRRFWWLPTGVPAAAGGAQVATGRVSQARTARGIVRSVGDREVLA